MSSELTAVISDGPNAAIKVVSLSGELDETNIDTLKVQLDPILVDPNIKALVFHIKDLAFINSKGIGYVVSVHTHLTKDQRQLILAEAQQAVMDVVSLVGLTSIIPYFATLEEANQSLSAS